MGKGKRESKKEREKEENMKDKWKERKEKSGHTSVSFLFFRNNQRDHFRKSCILGMLV